MLTETSSPAAAPVAAIARPGGKPPPDLRWLRRTLWLYLALWVFEGALRKWILPGLANPLLIVRDPVLLLMYAMALQKGVFPKNGFVIVTILLGAAAMVVSMLGTEAPLMVEVYGLRADYLHLPLIFLIPALFGRKELYAMGRWTLLLGLPMAALVLLQFLSRSTAWINAGASSGEGHTYMIGSAFGHIRPSGTFSFNNGVNGFTSVVLVFFLCHLLVKRVFPRLLWLAAIPALLLMVLLSGSRGALGGIAITLAATALISVAQPRYLQSAFKLAALGALSVAIVGAFAVFQQGLNVFSSRFGNAENVRTGFVYRLVTVYLAPLDYIPVARDAGVGLGMGTNVAAGLKDEGRRAFLLTEGEGGRVILENGPFVGTAYLLLRAAIAFQLGLLAWRSLRRDANPLPMLLFSACANNLLIGTFGQPTELGYTTIVAGLCLAAAQPGAALESGSDEEAEADVPVTAERGQRGRVPAARPAAVPVIAPPLVAAPLVRRARGRSAMAERLHEAEEINND